MGKHAKRIRRLEAELGRAREALDAPPLVKPPARAVAGGHLTSLATVYRCIAVLSSAARQLPVQQVTGAGAVEDLSEWLRLPQHYGAPETLPDLITGAIPSMITHGAGYFWVRPGGDRSWVLERVRPQRVTVAFDDRYRRHWSLDGRPVALVEPRTRSEGLLVAPYLLLDDVETPMGPLQAAARGNLAQGWTDTDQYATRVFRAGLHSGQRLESDQELQPETAQRYQQEWMAAHSDPAAPRIPVLGSGLKLATDVIDPRAAQWIEARTWNAQEQARILGVPARYLGLPAGDSITYTNARDNDRAFLQWGLQSYLQPITAAWSSLLPVGRNPAEDRSVRFDFAALLEPTAGSGDLTDQQAPPAAESAPSEPPALRVVADA